jgi:hypothetical protein
MPADENSTVQGVPPQDGMGPTEREHVPRKTSDLVAPLAERPIDPARLVVLAPVVVPSRPAAESAGLTLTGQSAGLNRCVR